MGLSSTGPCAELTGILKGDGGGGREASQALSRVREVENHRKGVVGIGQGDEPVCRPARLLS